MKKTPMRYLAQTVAFVLAGVICFGEVKTDASRADKEIEIPQDTQLEDFGGVLELDSYTLYEYTEHGVREFYYDATGSMYRSKETMTYEIDGCQARKIYDVRPSVTKATANIYTYRYLEDKTLCYMDKYEKGKFEYGRGWVWDADGRERMDVRYDSQGGIESVDCSYYDEEGRLAYEFGDMSDVGQRAMKKAQIHSYEYQGDHTVFGYVQDGKNDERKVCYRKDEIHGDVLLEAEFDEHDLESLEWYSYDNEGRVLYKINIYHHWEDEHIGLELTHYLYDEEGRCTESYLYDVKGDLFVEDEGEYSVHRRGFSAIYNGGEFPEDIVVYSAWAEPVFILCDLETGAVWDMDMGEE